MDEMPGMPDVLKGYVQASVAELCERDRLLTPRILHRYEKVGLAEFIHLPATDEPRDALAGGRLVVISTGSMAAYGFDHNDIPRFISSSRCMSAQWKKAYRTLPKCLGGHVRLCA